MSLQLYQVDHKSYLLDFKSLSEEATNPVVEERRERLLGEENMEFVRLFHFKVPFFGKHFHSKWIWFGSIDWLIDWWIGLDWFGLIDWLVDWWIGLDWIGLDWLIDWLIWFCELFSWERQAVQFFFRLLVTRATEQPWDLALPRHEHHRPPEQRLRHRHRALHAAPHPQHAAPDDGVFRVLRQLDCRVSAVDRNIDKTKQKTVGFLTQCTFDRDWSLFTWKKKFFLSVFTCCISLLLHCFPLSVQCTVFI